MLYSGVVKSPVAAVTVTADDYESCVARKVRCLPSSEETSSPTRNSYFFGAPKKSRRPPSPSFFRAEAFAPRTTTQPEIRGYILFLSPGRQPPLTSFIGWYCRVRALDPLGQLRSTQAKNHLSHCGKVRVSTLTAEIPRSPSFSLSFGDSSPLEFTDRCCRLIRIRHPAHYQPLLLCIYVMNTFSSETAGTNATHCIPRRC